MTRLLLIAASAALFATGASAQMTPSGNWEANAANCKKPQYASSEACKNFMEGRSSDVGAGGTPGPAGTKGNNNPGGSAGAGASGSGASPGGPGNSNSGSGAGGAN